MTQRERNRAWKACVALVAFIAGALLHIVLTDALNDPRSQRAARIELPSMDSASGVSSPDPQRKPSLLRGLRLPSNGTEHLDRAPGSVAHWPTPMADARPESEREGVALAGLDVAHRPRAPPAI